MVARNNTGKPPGNSASALARLLPSTTRERTPRVTRCTRLLSLCCATAVSASSSGRPERVSVASWRVNSASSVLLMLPPPLKSKLPRFCALPAATSCTYIGVRPRSRSICRTCRGVSPSISPLLLRPPASSAVYSKAAIGLLFDRHAQHFAERGLAGQHLVAAGLQDAGAALARGGFQNLLGSIVVDQRLQAAIHLDDFMDAAASLVTGMTAQRAPDRLVQGHVLALRYAQLLQLAHARCIRLLALPAQRAHQALSHQAHQRGRQLVRFHAHVAQARHRADRGIGMQ